MRCHSTTPAFPFRVVAASSITRRRIEPTCRAQAAFLHICKHRRATRSISCAPAHQITISHTHAYAAPPRTLAPQLSAGDSAPVSCGAPGPAIGPLRYPEGPVRWCLCAPHQVQITPHGVSARPGLCPPGVRILLKSLLPGQVNEPCAIIPTQRDKVFAQGSLP